jgi:thiol-disulfide isomerase/thioredoxin
MRRPFGTIFLAVILLALAVAARAEGLSNHVQRIDPPQKMPPLVFEDAHGAQHSLGDYRGKFVLLNIWATWCVPCVSEMPSLDALQRSADPARLAVIPLSEDRGDSVVGAFYKTHKITHLPIAVDHAGIAPSALKLRGLPTTLLIDPQGREVARIEGDEDWNSADAAYFLKSQMR